MTPTVFYLIGHAGTGKYTIGQAIARATGARLIDNHLINNPIFTLLPMDNRTPIPDAAWQRIEVIRTLVLDAAAEIAPPHFSFVLTNELLQHEESASRWYDAVEQMAVRRAALFRPVLLTADADTLAARIASPGRAERHKATDPARARNAAANHRLYGYDRPGVQVLDVSALSPDAAADAIIGWRG